MKKILLIVTGGVACYKALDFIRILKKKSIETDVILTASAQKFLKPLMFSALTERKIYTDESFWNSDRDNSMLHIELVQQVDAVVILPATANFISKVSHAIADDLALTTILSAKCPIFIVPAMNPAMWSNHILQKNMQILTQENYHIIPPIYGECACGDVGFGKMESVENIAKIVMPDLLPNQPLKKAKKLLINLGATKEYLDPIRFISNNSSGTQATLIIQQFINSGYEITIVSANISNQNEGTLQTLQQNYPYITLLKAESADDIYQTTQELIQKNQYDVFIATAAISDFKAKNKHNQKIKKNDSSEEIEIILEKNPDILAMVANHERRPNIVIGFSAETNDIITHSQRKLKNKHCDYIIANDVSDASIFGGTHTNAIIVSKTSQENLGIISKKDLAFKIHLLTS